MQRTREQDLAEEQIDSLVTSVANYSWKSSLVTTPVDSSQTSFSGHRETTDIVTPNYKELRGKGLIINNPYDSTLHKTRHNPLGFSTYTAYTNRSDGSTCNYEYNGYMLPFDGLGFAPSLDVSVNEDRLINQAITNAWAKVNEADMYALVSAAEAMKTFNSIVKLYADMKPLILAALDVKRQWKKGAITFGKACSHWLEFRYGLRPIYYDIGDAIKAYNSLNKPLRARFSSTISDSAEDSITGSASNMASLNVWVTPKMTRTVHCTVSAGVLVEGSSTPKDLCQAFGLDRFAESAWELIPYSFIVDWFFNVGKFIAAWSPKGDVRPLTSWVVIRRNTTDIYEILDMYRGLAADPPWECTANTVSWSGGTKRTDTEYTERIPRPERPAIPSLNIRLDVAKLLDLLALVWQSTELGDLLGHLRV